MINKQPAAETVGGGLFLETRVNTRGRYYRVPV
jgi:hypothetical protein